MTLYMVAVGTTMYTSTTMQYPTWNQKVVKNQQEGEEGVGQLHPVPGPEEDILFLKYDSRILRQSSNPVCGLSMMEQVRLCAVWTTENWLGSSKNHIKG